MLTVVIQHLNKDRIRTIKRMVKNYRIHMIVSTTSTSFEEYLKNTVVFTKDELDYAYELMNDKTHGDEY